MYKKPDTSFIFRSLMIISLLVCGVTASAQNSQFVLGSYHSPKGIGLGIEFNHPDSFRSDEIYITADLHRVLNSQVSFPGVRAVYEHNMHLVRWAGEDARYDFYVGPGLTAGYVRDQMNPLGLMAGLCADAGVQVGFDCGVSIALEFEASLALHLYKDLMTGVRRSSLYRCGYNRAYYPLVKIKYNFGK